MDLEDMLLYYSFSQIRGISEKLEKEHWAKGETLGDLVKNTYIQQTLFDGEQNQGNNGVQSLRFLQQKDATYFCNNLNRKFFYRIAYSFPQDVMFLDIETTGLSMCYHYITCVGWILNKKYGCWIQGRDPNVFLDAFRSSKLIVTFNGTMFDCKFLDHAFDTNEFSKKANLDLMYLCRRMGLVGGQKQIEHQIGFLRPQLLKETDGKEAIALWYSFLFGKHSALKQLIRYNFYDVLGMTYILDWIFFKKIYGHEFPKVGAPQLFSRGITPPKYTSLIPTPSEAGNIYTYVKKYISNFSRESLWKSNPYHIVGIDLAGKVSSRSGLCSLKGNVAKTAVAYTDEEIIQFVTQMNPDLISIDAPLSLPKGRTSVYDDDPMRESAGILRYSERELKHRNINCYPALIRSMQELTKRGIRLADLFRKNGCPVIECFPGAAQDVIQLPRKRTDESLLKKGLTRFGLNGPFKRKNVCHDELDAITAALVGQFFISGFYERLGIPEENDMIIPQKQYRIEPHDLVLGIVGPAAAGKTTLGRYLERLGFRYIRYSQIIQQELIERNFPSNRDDLRNTGATLFGENHQYELNQKVASTSQQYRKVVIDGMRHLEDYTFWKEQCFLRFFLVYVETDYKLRQIRFAARRDETISYEAAISHPAEAEIPLLAKKAEYIIKNNGTLKDLYTSAQKFLKEIE